MKQFVIIISSMLFLNSRIFALDPVVLWKQDFDSHIKYITCSKNWNYILVGIGIPSIGGTKVYGLDKKGKKIFTYNGGSEMSFISDSGDVVFFDKSEEKHTLTKAKLSSDGIINIAYIKNFEDEVWKEWMWGSSGSFFQLSDNGNYVSRSAWQTHDEYQLDHLKDIMRKSLYDESRTFYSSIYSLLTGERIATIRGEINLRHCGKFYRNFFSILS